MSRAWLYMIVVAVMLGLVSCGGDADRALTVSEPTSSASPNGDVDGSLGAPSTTDAQAALLTLDDLPAGWTVDPEDGGGGFGLGGSGGTPDSPESSECARVARELNDEEPIAEAEADFTAGGFGPYLTHSVSFFDQDTAPMVERLATVLGDCPEALSKQYEDPSFDYRIQPLSFPELGDRTTAVRMVAMSGFTTATFDFVAVAVDRTVSILFTGGSDTLDGSELERLARLSVDRIS